MGYPISWARALTKKEGSLTYHDNARTIAHQRTRIRHSLTKAYHSWTNGLVERARNTITAEKVYRRHFDSTAMMDAALYGFERYSN